MKYNLNNLDKISLVNFRKSTWEEYCHFCSSEGGTYKVLCRNNKSDNKFTISLCMSCTIKVLRKKKHNNTAELLEQMQVEKEI